MVRVGFMIWTYFGAAVCLGVGIWLLILPYGATWAGVLFVLGGLGLGIGISLHVREQWLPRARHRATAPSSAVSAREGYSRPSGTAGKVARSHVSSGRDNRVIGRSTQRARPRPKSAAASSHPHGQSESNDATPRRRRVEVER